MRRYRNMDPHWITARYAGSCGAKGCGAPVRKGDRCFYYPNGRKLYGASCGCAESAAADFESHRQDEELFAPRSYGDCCGGSAW